MLFQLRKSITTLAFVACAGLLGEAAAQVPAADLKASAPDRYVVVQGDTLWSIAQRYLDAPQRWPELWEMNRETLRSPHRIYPGDVLVLDRNRGQLAIMPTETIKLSPQVRAESSPTQEIPSIPPSLIEPYLTRPLVIEPNGLDNAPEIIATEEIGLCAVGAGGALLESGDTRLGGRLPVNPSGGLLSKGEPVGASGLGQVFEIVSQLRDRCGPRQVPNARIGLTHTLGAGGNACVLIFGRS